MKELQLPGEVTFLAVDKLWIDDIPEYPSQSEANALVNLVSAEDESCHELTKVIKFVFGKYLIVKDTDTFPQFANSGFDCLTLDGQHASRKGVLIGGFHKPGASLLDQYQDFSRTRDDDKIMTLNHLESELSQRELRKLAQTEAIQSEKNKIER